jgi:hypothetical protein
MDETYAQIVHDDNVFRLGRIRPSFGLSNWSDFYYTPFIGLPMIRSYSVNVVPGVSLFQLARGAEIAGSKGAFQYQASAVDSSDDDWHVLPGQTDTGVARFQFSQGRFILGMSGFDKVADNYGPAEQIVGIDYRYTAPRLQIRGELIRGTSTSGASGYYVDLFYRPPKLSRTQVGFRAQGIDAPAGSGYWDGSFWAASSGNGHVYSFAARQFLSPNFTLSVNYGTGSNIQTAQGLLGWSVQLQSIFRF